MTIKNKGYHVYSVIKHSSNLRHVNSTNEVDLISFNREGQNTRKKWFRWLSFYC